LLCLLFAHSFLCTVPLPLSIHTLSLHDALPIWDLMWRDVLLDLVFSIEEGLVRDEKAGGRLGCSNHEVVAFKILCGRIKAISRRDRKSTRLNSSHVSISYAVFCLKKKIYITSN